MARSLPPLTWFRAFESAARHLNFTAAARELGITQSAVSQHVRALEVRFDTVLFIRKARGLALTDAGRRLLPDVSRAMSHITSAAHAFEAPSPDRMITVASSVSFAQWFIAPRLGGYLEAHPNSRVRVITTIWPDDFIVSSADVEIRFGGKKQVGKAAQQLKPDKLVIVAAPQWFEGSKFLDDKALSQIPFIQTVGTSNSWKYWAKETGMASSVNETIFVDNYGLAVDLAKQGVGLALVSSLIAAPELASGAIKLARPETIDPIDGYFLAANLQSNGLGAKDFVDWLMRDIQTLTERP